MSINRLSANHAPAIVDCFRRVYGDTYANETFYDVNALGDAMTSGTICCVGAVSSNGEILGHMAMTLHPHAKNAELGNTVVDPRARGEGLAWEIGAALGKWCIELGFHAYLHYPTTDHHIMQRQSVKSGFETGVMLGYLPANTDGKVNHSQPELRGAATIVYQPLTAEREFESGFVPKIYHDELSALASACDLTRDWEISDAVPATSMMTLASRHKNKARSLSRLEVQNVGSDFLSLISGHVRGPEDCKHLDFRFSDPCIGHGVLLALSEGYHFCGWLPGYREVDVLRLQSFDSRSTDLQPGVVNATAQKLLVTIQDTVL